MLYVRATRAQASFVHTQLISLGVLDRHARVEHDGDYTFFPVTATIPGYECVERESRPHRKPLSLPLALEPLLSPDERAALIGSYDIVGNIAILEIPDALVAKEQAIAQAVLSSHTHVRTVLKKAQKHGGEFRTQSFTYLAGEDTREARVIESGCTMLVDVEQVYFSVRLSTERLRIASLVQPGEHVLVLFSGAAPYVCILARHSVADKIVGVEKNPIGHKYGLENLRLNKIRHATLYEADCADLSFLPEHFDRVIMPLPASSIQFLPAALQACKNKAVIHLYYFASEEDLPEIREQIRAICVLHGFSSYLQRTVRAGHHAPYVYRWCLDIAIEKK